jgi:hypothetical protein
MVLELCGGAECSCFISYIQLEEYYASQVQDDQFGVNAQMDVNGSPAFPYNQYFANQGPMKSKNSVVEFTPSLAWLDAHEEGFFQLPETVTYIGMPKMTTNSTTTSSTATRRVPETKAETKDFSIYSTQEMSLYRTQEESAGFQKGNSVSIPIPSLLIAPATSTATGGERAGMLQNC